MLVCCVVCCASSALCDGLITSTNEVLPCVCVCVCVGVCVCVCVCLFVWPEVAVVPKEKRIISYTTDIFYENVP